RFPLDMLTGKNALGPDFGRVVRVDWRARDAGWLTDDFAVTFRTATGDERAAGISAKDYQLLGRNGFRPNLPAQPGSSGSVRTPNARSAAASMPSSLPPAISRMTSDAPGLTFRPRPSPLKAPPSVLSSASPNLQ